MIVLAYFALAITFLLLVKALLGALALAAFGALMLIAFGLWLAFGEEAEER